MNGIALEVLEQVNLYFKENLPQYTVLQVKKKSFHPADSHLYMVSAKKKDGTYAVWTCWNDSTRSLNYGHYGLKSESDCESIMADFYHSGNL